jgi:hypothetical protein
MLVLFTLTINAQGGSNIAPNLNQECDATVCDDIKFGACEGDTYSDGSPVNNTDFEVYYSDVDVIINFNSVTFRNARFELRNGANLVDNGVQINEETDCDNENTTEIVFIGGGDRFSSVEEMNATLSIKNITEQIKNQELPDNVNFNLYDVSGRSIIKGNTNSYTFGDIESQVKTGVYFFIIETEFGRVSVKAILR